MAATRRVSKKVTKKKASRKKATTARAVRGLTVMTYTGSLVKFPDYTRSERDLSRFHGDYVERLRGSLIHAGDGRTVWKASCGECYEFTADKKQVQQMIDFLATCL